MSDLQDLIKRIKVSPVDPISYVYFAKESGEIHKISTTNVCNDNFEIVVIPTDDLRPILTGEKRTDQFIILYDISLKQLRLQEKTADLTQYSPTAMCYRIPMYSNTPTELIIQQDLKNKTWSIIVNKTLRQFLLQGGHNLNEIFYFSITAKYDPNIFYRSLKFTMKQLLSTEILLIPFKYDVENIESGVSIYTAKYFDNYAHEVI